MVEEPSQEKHIFLIHMCKIGLTKENSVFPYTAKTQYRNSKQLSPEKELHGLSPNFHIHMSVSDTYTYIPTIGLPILLAGKYVDRSWEYINLSQTHERGS